MGGGGGSAGAVQFPQYIEDTHKIFMYKSTGMPTVGMVPISLTDVMTVALGPNGNPFSGFALTQPSGYFNAVTARYGTFESLVDALDPVADYNAVVARAVAAVRTSGVLQKVNGAGEASQASGASSEGLNDWLEELDLADGEELWSQYITTVKAKLIELDLFPDFDLSTAITEATAAADSLMAAAMAAALAAAATFDLSALALSLRADLDDRVGDQTRDYLAGMADANAIQTSPFLIGLARIHERSNVEYARALAEIRVNLLSALLNAHTGIFGSVLQSHTARGDQAARLRESLLNNGVSSIMNLFGTERQREQGLSSLYMQGFATHLQGRIQAALGNVQSHTQTFLAQQQLVQQQDSQYLQMQLDTLKLLSEVQRIRFVAEQEYETSTLDIDEKHARWDIEIYEKAFNMLSAPSGMAAMVPKSPSRIASALGGAISGLATAGPLGAIAGGLAGLLG